MDENLALTLETYFNGELQADLKYVDKYDKPIYLPGERMIFFKRKFKVGDFGIMLYNDPQLVTNIKTLLLDLLSNYFQGIYDIKLEFTPDGFAIQILSSLLGLNTDFYFNIFKHFETPEQIDNFCMTNKDAMELCRSKDFWRMLFKSVYNFPYKYEYNYQQLYKEYLIYTQKKKMYEEYRYLKSIGDISLTRKWIGVEPSSKYTKELINFFFKEGIDDPADYLFYIWPSLYLGNQEIIQKVKNGIYIEKRGLKRATRLKDILSDQQEIKDIFLDLDYGVLNNLFSFLKSPKAPLKGKLRNTIFKKILSTLTRTLYGSKLNPSEVISAFESGLPNLRTAITNAFTYIFEKTGDVKLEPLLT